MAPAETHALIVASHPDDAEFGAAGTVAGWTAAGKRVVYLLCTSGEKGSGDRATVPEELAMRREQEQRDAAAVLGVAEVEFLRHPDQGLEDTAAFRKQIVTAIRRHRPRVVVTSDPYRRYIWHRDHRITGQVVLDAVFPYARDHLAYPDLLRDGLEPHKVKELWFWASEEPNHYVDITTTFGSKFQALCAHVSQVRELGIGDLEGWLRTRCADLAAGCEFELAESFHRVVAPP